MKWCKKCVLPDTRPGLKLNSSGICNACEVIDEKETKIDWASRNRAFDQVVQNAKGKAKTYDCIVPVSGGKDSTWQVLMCLEYGLKPLAVTWKTPARTEIGQKNLDNLISLGVDHIDFQINPKVERKFLLESLQRYGTTGIPMHMAIYNIPLMIANKFDIPLVVYGENSGFEYGGSDEATRGFKVNREWLKKFGVTHGTTAKDWISDTLSEKDMIPYFGPDSDELEAKDINAIFLGHYFKWDPQMTYRVAKENGFQVRSEGAKTGHYNFADIDDDFISVHHFLKWYKFGFTRLFDNLSLEIRNSRMTREEAVRVIRDSGDQTPHDDIKKFCDFVKITESEFYNICEKFRNLSIWKHTNGKWKMDEFLIQDWNWK